MDFVALLKYGGPDARALRALDWLEADSPPEIKSLAPLFRERGFSIGDGEATVWEYHHRPDLHDARLNGRPKLPKLEVALHMKEDFFLTFGEDAIEVYHLLRWHWFLKDLALQKATLDACSRFAHLFGATACIITSDFSPVIHAFRAGAGFDASLATAGPEDGERAALADLYQERPEGYLMRDAGGVMQYQEWDQDKTTPVGWERATTWDSKGYWRFPIGDKLQDSGKWTVSPPSSRGPAMILLDKSQWATSDDPQAMLEYLLRQDAVSTRKVRLWACACVRRIWPFLVHENSRRAVEATERYVDGQGQQQEVDHWAKAAGSVRKGNRRANEAAELTARLCSAPSETSRFYGTPLEFPPSNVADAAVDALVGTNDQLPARTLQRKEQAELLRDIFGATPFHPVTIEASWKTSTVVALAATIYSNRDLPSGRLDATRLGVLADAMEEAGCNDERVLQHLREERLHVRGCWVVDGLLCKE